MSTISIRLNQEEEAFFKSYASLQGVSLSTLFKQSLAEKIEDAHDLNIYKQAKVEYLEDTETMSHDDFKKSLGF
ncbi:type II toxin-antitoxin system RelB family antitoxin [Streptococcus jiangjianxini]|uniref:type II toxin-antitoxin system RelB family antitoxin n=1 Tax=Streptococcus jiangjianxini TaxID=3161189 RepID=UPI0032ED22E2